ncbi:MAG: hypothetical protein KC464_12540, partial [Myxococcales bacterium]|nr:hypothetical protein [Myxococcales bacterium]
PAAKVDPPAAKVDPPAAKVDPPAAKVDPARVEFTLTRSELDAALSDFARIGREVEMTTSSAGVKLVRVAKDSFFYRMGLRDGDLVRKVDGKPIRGLDDAAAIYARLGKAKSFAVELDRGSAHLALRYQITR